MCVVMYNMYLFACVFTCNAEPKVEFVETRSRTLSDGLKQNPSMRGQIKCDGFFVFELPLGPCMSWQRQFTDFPKDSKYTADHHPARFLQ